jgi:hypothetical protein
VPTYVLFRSLPGSSYGMARRLRNGRHKSKPLRRPLPCLFSLCVWCVCIILLRSTAYSHFCDATCAWLASPHVSRDLRISRISRNQTRDFRGSPHKILALSTQHSALCPQSSVIVISKLKLRNLRICCVFVSL